jgi:hypothetical protein
MMWDGVPATAGVRALPLTYTLTYAGVPLVNDGMRAYRAQLPEQAERQQAAPDLQAEIEKRFTFDWDRDLSPEQGEAGRAWGAVARQLRQEPLPGPKLRLGDYHYPFGACRWSVFRSLATGAQVRAMLAATTPGTAAPFVMRSDPLHGAASGLDYAVGTDLHLLPPRPLFAQSEAADGLAADGLYLVSLVDERYFWRGLPVTLAPTTSTTWVDLISSLASALGVSITYSAIEGAWSRPEQDSQLWNAEAPAGVLLDAVAHDVGRTVVRNLGGSYSLLTPAESKARADASRGLLASAGAVVRQGGGQRQRVDGVTPSTVRVSYPRYAQSPAGFIDSRSATDQYRKDTFGSLYTVAVPLTSGGTFTSGALGNGLPEIIHDTAKAVYPTSADAASGQPSNRGALHALAQLQAQRHWAEVRASSLDEAYPGTYVWQPDGLHDITWSWSESRQDVSCRVQRREWAAVVRDQQHATPLTDDSGGALTLPVPPCCPDRATAVTLTGTQTAYAFPDATDTLHVTAQGGGAVTFAGVELPPGKTAAFVNAGTGTVTFTHDSPLADVEDRIFLPSGVGSSLTLQPRDQATFVNDELTGQTRLVVTTAGSSLTTTIGDGVSTTLTVTHGFGSSALTAGVQRVSTGEVVYPAVRFATTDTVTVTFLAPPATDEYRVVVQKGGAGSGTTSLADGQVLTTGLTFQEGGLKVRDSVSGHDLTISTSGLTADSSVVFTASATVTPYASLLISSSDQLTAKTRLGLSPSDSPSFTAVTTPLVTGGTAGGANLVLRGSSSTSPGTVDALAVSTDTITARDVSVIRHLTASAAAAGFGVSQAYAMENDGGTELTAGRTSYVWTDAAAGSEDSDYVIWSARAGVLTQQVRVTSTGALRLAEISTPATPAAGTVLIYTKADGKPYSLDDAGTETGLSGGRTEGALASAGNSQGTAAVITTDAALVTGADGVKGVRLPDTAAALVLVGNDDAAGTLLVYPQTGAAINLSAANASVSLAAKAYQLYMRISATQWTTGPSGILP